MATMMAPTTPYEIAGATLIEVGRKTPGIQQRYETARAEYLTAARELNQHCERFEQRADEFIALGGVVDPEKVAEHQTPYQPNPILPADYVSEG